MNHNEYIVGFLMYCLPLIWTAGAIVDVLGHLLRAIASSIYAKLRMRSPEESMSPFWHMMWAHSFRLIAARVAIAAVTHLSKTEVFLAFWNANYLGLTVDAGTIADLVMTTVAACELLRLCLNVIRHLFRTAPQALSK